MDTANHIHIPELALVVLMGASGSGKSTFARTHFKSTEIISSDFCRGLISDDENNQAATEDAFDLLHFLARKRLARGLQGSNRARGRSPSVNNISSIFSGLLGGLFIPFWACIKHASLLNMLVKREMIVRT